MLVRAFLQGEKKMVAWETEVKRWISSFSWKSVGFVRKGGVVPSPWKWEEAPNCMFLSALLFLHASLFFRKEKSKINIIVMTSLPVNINTMQRASVSGTGLRQLFLPNVDFFSKVILYPLSLIEMPKTSACF